MKQKVQGIGGVFFKVKDPEKSKAWYKKHLGVDTNQYGAKFVLAEDETASEKTAITWSTMKDDTDYFAPSAKDVMINYRVSDLESFLIQLEEEGVTQVGEMQTYEYGKFAWILDPDGYKVELWVPMNEHIL